MKQTSLWNEVLNDEHYGKQWQSMNLPKEKLENLIASEVHSRIVQEIYKFFLKKIVISSYLDCNVLYYREFTVWQLISITIISPYFCHIAGVLSS